MDASKTLRCPVVSCNAKVGIGDEFISHLASHQSVAPYNPKANTLLKFHCKRCEQCKQIVVLDHACYVRKEKFELPCKTKYNTTVDVSWTITARGERDIHMSTFSLVTKIIDEYFEYGIASTERGQKNNHLHIQATGRLYFYDDEVKIKKLGGNKISTYLLHNCSFIFYINFIIIRNTQRHVESN
jgi:hypothetical protein